MLVTKDVSAIVSLAAGRAGFVCAYPTETFYGLGARIDDEAALQRIMRLKGRDAMKGMIVLVADMAMAEALAEIHADQRALLERFWPGPLSAILPARSGIHPLLCIAGKISLRVSPNADATALVRKLGPITSTSANISGRPPSRSVEEVMQHNLAIDAILDGGVTPGGAPSTLVDFTMEPPCCLREGVIAWEEILSKGTTAG